MLCPFKETHFALIPRCHSDGPGRFFQRSRFHKVHELLPSVVLRARNPQPVDRFVPRRRMFLEAPSQPAVESFVLRLRRVDQFFELHA